MMIFSPRLPRRRNEGFPCLPARSSVGLIPWALVTGMSMVSIGMTPLQAMGMNVIVFAGTAQLGTLPLIAAGAPLWLIVATALALNLRFPHLQRRHRQGLPGTSAGLGAGSPATFDRRRLCHLRREDDGGRGQRTGGWATTSPSDLELAAVAGLRLVGVLAAGSILRRHGRSEFMATIALDCC